MSGSKTCRQPSAARPGSRRALARRAGLSFVVVAIASTVRLVAAPEEPGPACATRLEPLVRRIMAERGVPGAIVSVEIPGVCRWKAALGSGSAAGRRPISFRDHVRVGSITKTMTGTAVLQLVDDRRIGLDDPISRHLSGVPNGEKITIRQMLYMRSGLATYSNDAGFNASLDTETHRVWKPAELLAIAFRHPPDFPPGTSYTYSNTNTVLLGQLVEKLRGLPLHQVFAERIFEPLGLDETSLPTTAALPSPHARGYMFGSNVGTLDGKCDAGTVGRHDVTNASPSWTWAAGGVVSTLRDLTVWARALATGKLLTPATHAARLDWLSTGPASAPSYGLHVANFFGVIGHDGALPGYQSFIGYVPSKDGTVVILTNVYNDKMCGSPADTIFKAVARELALF